MRTEIVETTTTPAVDLAAEITRIALLKINQEIDDVEASLALGPLVPHLFGEDMWAAFEDLCAALLELQNAENGFTDLATLDPEYRNAEVWEEACLTRADDALNALTGDPR